PVHVRELHVQDDEARFLVDPAEGLSACGSLDDLEPGTAEDLRGDVTLRLVIVDEQDALAGLRHGDRAPRRWSGPAAAPAPWPGSPAQAGLPASGAGPVRPGRSPPLRRCHCRCRAPPGCGASAPHGAAAAGPRTRRGPASPGP